MATVLVVDDEPDLRVLVRFALGLDGHEVVEAATGEEALEVVRRHRVELVVLDVRMGGIGGWATLQALKADLDPAVQEIPVVMLTALDTAEDRARSGIEGAVDHLAKPASPAHLRAAVAAALDGEPEPVKRRRAQARALEDLARLERAAGTGTATSVDGPRLRLTGLEVSRPADRRVAPRDVPVLDLRAAAALLTDKQHDVLRTVRDAPTVLEAAAALGTSRSNVYASLRRIARRLGVHGVPELLAQLRAGNVL